MKKFAFFSDLLFAFSVVFFFSLCLFRYFRISLWISLVLALFSAAGFSCLFFLFLHKKSQKIFLKKSEERQRDKLIRHFILQGKQATLQFFSEYFGKFDRDGDSTPEPICARIKENAEIYLPKQTSAYFPAFSFAPVTEDDLAPILLSDRDAQRFLLCKEASDGAKRLCESFSIEIISQNEIFKMLEKAERLPQSYLGADVEKKKRRGFNATFFKKSNSRAFLTGGILILITSLITPFPKYYLVFGTVLLLSAVFVRIFGYR